MTSKAKKAYPKKYDGLTIDLAKKLGRMLLEISDKYPLFFRTETDFYPLVFAYFHLDFPGIRAEFAHQLGRIDFKFGGTTNPGYLELAVAPRALGDLERPRKAPPKTELYATKNSTELKKLSALPQSKAKQRVLLLVDLRKDPHDIESLTEQYLAEGKKLDIENTVNVIYVHRDRKKADKIIVSRAKCGL